MSPKGRQQPPASTPARGALILTGLLSVLASLVAVAALAIVLTRSTGEDPCRSLAWGAVPARATLPAGWTLGTSRFFVDNATLTLVGPAASGATEGPTVYVSVSCYGPDAKRALARARDAAIATGATEQPIHDLGDDSFAVSSEATGTTVYVLRGELVADLTAPASVDQPTLEALLFAVDTAMSAALAAPSQPSAVASAGGGTASPVASGPSGTLPSPSPATSPSPTAVSHLVPDLEARLPGIVDGTTLSIDSVTGATALGSDATSQAMAESLAGLGKTSSDLQIARARDPAGERPIRLYAFRVIGIGGADLAELVTNALLSETSAAPVASQVTLGGVQATKLTYSQGPSEYLFAVADGVVFNVETTDEDLAATVLPTLE